jgi:hypothetical protein
VLVREDAKRCYRVDNAAVYVEPFLQCFDRGIQCGQRVVGGKASTRGWPRSDSTRQGALRRTIDRTAVSPATATSPAR